MPTSQSKLRLVKLLTTILLFSFSILFSCKKLEVKEASSENVTFGVNTTQGYKDNDCALYKYFLKVGNSDQHLNYWLTASGNISDEVRYYSCCFKIY
jgi:hypothetical protein